LLPPSFRFFREWLDTLAHLPPTLQYRDFVSVGRELSNRLRDPNGDAVDLVIALTHMRVPNDEILREKCSKEIDLILGGHV